MHAINYGVDDVNGVGYLEMINLLACFPTVGGEGTEHVG